MTPGRAVLLLGFAVVVVGTSHRTAPAVWSGGFPGGEASTCGREGPSRAVEPAGLRPVGCLDLDDAHVRGSPADERIQATLRKVAPRWRFSETSRLEIVRDSTVPDSGTESVPPESVPRARFPAGWVGGYSPVWITRDLSGEELTRIHLSFRLKVSENWQGHPVGDKLLYVWIHDHPAVFPVYVGGGHEPLSAQVRIQDVPHGAHNFSPNLREAPVERGRWHHWELLLDSGTPGLADGEIHWWIDGEKKGEHRHVRFVDAGQDDLWHIVSWRPVWGGRGSVVREDQFMWIDDLYIGGRR